MEGRGGMSAITFRPFFGLSPWPWKATRRIWGFCYGESSPSYAYESKRFETQEEAEKWAVDEPQPTDRKRA